MNPRGFYSMYLYLEANHLKMCFRSSAFRIHICGVPNWHRAHRESAKAGTG